MSLWKIAWRSIQQRALASTLTSVSMALGVALVVAVLVIHGVVGDSFKNNAGLGYNLIVGAKGGKLQLVLNTVYYLSSPVENIPYSYYKEFTEGRFKKYCDRVIPVCLGDYYDKYRVVGTTPAMFDQLQYGDGKNYEFAEGRNFKTENFFDAVIGATVAREAGVKLEEEVNPTHGAPEGHKHGGFKVVGILAPTGTPNDRAVFINIEGFYLLEGHARNGEPAHGGAEAHSTQAESDPEKHLDDDDEGHDEHHHHADEDHHPLPESQREVTAILIRNASFNGAPPEALAPALVKTVNKEPVAQAVQPIGVIYELFSLFVQPIQWILLGLTVLIVIVSGIGILVSIYNSMNDRRREIAIMRALGARRQTVLLVVLSESILLSLLGGVLGWFLGHTLMVALSPWITTQTGVEIGFWQFAAFKWVIMEREFVIPYEGVIVPGLVLLASAVGFLPALVAYRTDVAKALTANP